MADTARLRDRAVEFEQQIQAVRAPLSLRSLPCAYMVNQLFRAASAIPAVLEDADVDSRVDMSARHAIALHEAKEARYWLRLLVRSHVDDDALAPLEQDVNEFVAELTTTVQQLRAHEPA